jgi:hypothetical protein
MVTDNSFVNDVAASSKVDNLPVRCLIGRIFL